MGTSIGVISLDLVIKEQISNQLDGFKQKIASGFSKPMEQASNTVKSTMDKAFESVKKTVDGFNDKVKESFDDLSAKSQKPMDEMSKRIEGVFKNCNISANPFERLESQADNIIDKMDDLKKNYSSLQSKLGRSSSSNETQKILKQMNQIDGQMLVYAERLDKIKGKMTALSENPAKKIRESLSGISKEIREKLGNFKVSTDPIERLKAELENTKEKSDILQKRWQELTYALEQPIGEQEAEKLRVKLNATEKQLIYLINSADKTESIIEEMSKAPSIFQRIKESIASVKEKLNTVKNALSKLTAPIRKVASVITKTLGGAFKSLKSIGGKALNSLKEKISVFKRSADGASKPLSKLGKFIKSAAKSALLMTGLYAVFRGLKSAITDACNGNDEFAKSLNSVKANLNIAFEPIKNTIMPYINALMQGLAKVTQTVAAFINSLFGTTYQKSLNTLKKAQKANKDAAKEAKTYLASFDEMNVAQDASSDSSSSDSGIDYSAINGDNVKLPDWAERMKDAIRSGDWKGVGALLAEKVNSAFLGINWSKVQNKVNGFMKGIADGLNGFIKKLKWKQLGKTFSKGINTIFGGMYTFMKTFDWGVLGKGIADFLNGAIEDADWELIGRTLASRITAVIDTLYAFVTNFDFSGFGKSIGESVNAWFDEIDWAKLGETISESIKGLFDTIMGFLETVDWQGIGEKLWTLVKSIDWGGIAEKLFKTIGEAIGAAVSFLWGFIKEAVFKIGDYFKGKMQECGGNVILGLLKGLLDGIKNIGIWIKDHIFKPFMDGFKKVFGIHSPSKIMAEMGGFLIDGLLGAIKAGIALIKNVFKTMVSVIKSIITPIADFFKNLFSGIFGSIKNILGGIIQFIKGVFTGNWSSAWDGVKKIFKGVWDGLVTVVKAPINLIIGAVNAMLGAVESGINWVIDGINKLSFDIPDWVPVVGGETFGFDIPTVDIPEIPKLAMGGLATAPTLAMVGDNRNAKADPEVIAPLSKLQGMLTDGAGISEIIALLREIVDILKSLDFTFEGKINERILWKAIVKLYREHKVRTGGALI